MNNLWSFHSSSFWWSSEPLMMSASGEHLLRRVLLMTSASSVPLVFRTSFLQTLQASFFVESIALICSSRTYTWIKDTKFFSMVLHAWTNISISNWHILIPCYHQNSKGNVKHTLFQQYCCSKFVWGSNPPQMHAAKHNEFF